MKIIEDRHNRKVPIISNQSFESGRLDTVREEMIADAILDRIIHYIASFSTKRRYFKKNTVNLVDLEIFVKS